MITDSFRRARELWQVPVAVAALCGLLELLGDSGRAGLAYERSAVAAGQWWRLVTGNFVHLGPYHLLLNVIGLAVLVLLCRERLPLRSWALRFLVLSLSVTLGLYLFAPQWQSYVGLSGVQHGLFLLGLVPLARRGDRIALVALLYLFGKLAWELVAGVPVSDEQELGGRVVLEAHLFGTIGALLYGLVSGALTRRPLAVRP